MVGRKQKELFGVIETFQSVIEVEIRDGQSQVHYLSSSAAVCSLVKVTHPVHLGLQDRYQNRVHFFRRVFFVQNKQLIWTKVKMDDIKFKIPYTYMSV